MKKITKSMAILALLTSGSLAFAQNIKNIPEVKNSDDKALIVKADHQELEAKKKAAEEKTKLPKPYDPKADAEKDIEKMIAQAKKEGKNVIIQAGGNWCIWCLRFNQYVQTTPELKKLVDDNYVYYHLNYSPDNKNEKVFTEYGNPGDKFGYPVFIVLDQNGKMIHVQQSDVLEEGKSYSLEKVKEFFKTWTTKS
ncbi:thioredoxin family protein [Chryseobacterium chendengshani]|uniref:thioredoxin family protein n=1 Tax=Chryseobacterium sp. LJ668 TaxID=2864040 RepID=UPI001C6914A7|nr:thioredoxin family protein [Chryseobacterium sp. LJ668]MBW8522539.1 thioredoxin family protein [Chryseobacterium sp. LJ668]QYK16077.1 thioredoxin family protein [Chryseobacterium sp. LJ668]